MTVMEFVVGLRGSSRAITSRPRWSNKILHPALWFLVLLTFVAVVSVHDAALLVVNQDAILEFEQNPIGSWLININNGSVWLFVILKLLGTSVVCAILASIYEYSKPLALIVVLPLATFQAALLGLFVWSLIELIASRQEEIRNG